LRSLLNGSLPGNWLFVADTGVAVRSNGRFADQQDTIRKRRVELSDPGTEHRVFGYNTVQLSKTFLVARRITPATFPIRLLILLTLIAFGLTRSAIGTRLDSFLLDEYYHITAGVSYVRLGDYRLNPEHLRW
jgi:hypothetical protein